MVHVNQNSYKKWNSPILYWRGFLNYKFDFLELLTFRAKNSLKDHFPTLFFLLPLHPLPLPFFPSPSSLIPPALPPLRLLPLHSPLCSPPRSSFSSYSLKMKSTIRLSTCSTTKLNSKLKTKTNFELPYMTSNRWLKHWKPETTVTSVLYHFYFLLICYCFW